jgi:spore maturation protein CgeB
MERMWLEFNQEVCKRAELFRPDILFVVNEHFLLPETIKYIRDKIGAATLCWVADDPFDSSRYKVFPVSLNYFTHIFVAEPLWMPQIHMISKPKILEVLHGAANIDIFHPIEISDEERDMYKGKISFVGSSYGGKYEAKVEGFYRGAILEAAADMGLRLWGDRGWNLYFRHFPLLESSWTGRGTSLNETNIINQVSDIVLNISNPQLFTAPQLRTFEIPASGGFQLADKRSEINKLFPNGEIIQFSSPAELQEKIHYYLDHEDERIDLAKRARSVVLAKHTFKHRVKAMLGTVH